MGKYKGNNKKGLAFHAEAKYKNYKEEKLRKPYEAQSQKAHSSFLRSLFYNLISLA